MKTLFTHIKQLVQVRENPSGPLRGADLGQLPIIENAYLLVEDGRIAEFGLMSELPSSWLRDGAISQIDASGRLVLPTWVDSHTHIVYAGSREPEFVDKINGLSYEEIARRGGGILNSAKRLQATSEDDLYEQSLVRLKEIISLGTGAVEIKSGYGLTAVDEIKMLRVIKRLKEVSTIPIKATFLGAHALPAEYRDRREDYVRLIIDEMMPVIAREGLASYVDVFCDRGFFTPEETAAILKAGAAIGLKGKIHANELDYSGGIQTGVAHGAISVDHLEFTGADEIQALQNSTTIPTLLPSTAFFLGLHYPPARKMIEANLPVSLATDYNPGSSPSGNMAFVLSLACIKMKMTPAEAINAATVNAAHALEIHEQLGSITRGKKANLILTKPVYGFETIPYAFGSSLTERVFINGESVDVDQL